MSRAQLNKVNKLIEHRYGLEDEAESASTQIQYDSVMADIARIDAQLEREHARATQIGNYAAIEAMSGITGEGSLIFQVDSPAGVGRLTRLPFFPEDAVGTNYVTGSGDTTANTSVPTVGYVSPAGTANEVNIANGAVITLKTPKISWAEIRVVGFEVDMQGTNFAIGGTQALVSNSIPAPKLIVSDLKIGGGANLFTHEDYADAQIYSSESKDICGLRSYPVLNSPNQAQVDAAAVGVMTSLAGSAGITFTCNLICEIISDDEYGSHLPGPYARGQAIARRS